MAFVIDETIEINAPAEVVWEVITDLPSYREWNPFCLECRSTLKPGDPIEMTVQLASKPQKVVEWVKEFVPGRRFAYSMKPVPAGALTSLRSHDVQPIETARTRYRSHFELHGWLRPLVLGLYRSKLEQGFAGMTAAIGRRAERLAIEQRAGKTAVAGAV